MVGSLVAHALLLLLFSLVPARQAPERIMELSLVQQGDPTKDGGQPPTAEPPPKPSPPEPQPPTPRPTPPVAPDGQLAAAEAVPPRPPAPRSEPTPPQPDAPLSFRDWQRQNRSAFLPSRAIQPDGGGQPDGRDYITQRGRDRCEPPAGRPAQVVYLLFDSSGSMNSASRAQALSCANQYARSVLASGALVVVGNFARGVSFSGPTRDILDIEIALRAASDPRYTNLPARELQPVLAQSSGRVADLVIISDGWFATPREVLVWYRYFLELGAENRGIMYTVGTPGRRQAVAQLRSLGFDVYEYQPIRGTPSWGPRAPSP